MKLYRILLWYSYVILVQHYTPVKPHGAVLPATTILTFMYT